MAMNPILKRGLMYSNPFSGALQQAKDVQKITGGKIDLVPGFLDKKVFGAEGAQGGMQGAPAQASFQDRLAAVQAARNKDLEAGRARGQEMFAQGSLGRVEEGRAKEIADIIAERQKRSKGYTPEELQAYREQNQKEIQRTGQSAQRQQQMALARSGVRGAAAAAQQAALLKAQQGQMAQNERDLYLNQIQRRDAALQALEGSTNTARQEELQRQTFNFGQLGKEKSLQLATELGYGGLGAGERSAIMQSQAAENAADKQNALVKSQSSGKK